MIRVASPAGLPGVVGQSATGAWFEIDQDRIAAFAEATEDRQWIHLDRDRAASGPFGGTIAHGYLTLSLLPHLASGLLVRRASCEARRTARHTRLSTIAMPWPPPTHIVSRP